MAFQRTEGAGGQPIADVSTTQIHPLGMKVKAYDTTYGEGEFVYGKGVASTIVGSALIINLYTGITALTAARSKGIVGIAMSILDAATKFGWFQVRGSAVAAVAGTVVAGATPYLSATPGKVDDAVVAGDIVYGANFATADATPAANFAVLSLMYPYVGDTDAT